MTAKELAIIELIRDCTRVFCENQRIVGYRRDTQARKIVERGRQALTRLVALGAVVECPLNRCFDTVYYQLAPKHPALLVAQFDGDKKRRYQKLCRFARQTGHVLVYEHGDISWSLELIPPRDADNPEYLHGRLVVFDPRTDFGF